MSLTESSIYDLLKDALNNDVNNYSIISQGANKKGEGYLGKINYVSLKHKTNGKLLHLVIKEAFTDEEIRTENRIRSYYLNEIYFYDKVWPALQKFQTEIPSVKPFDKLPKCFATTCKDTEEKLVLENLKRQNFATFDRKGTFDKEHVEYIFKQYGRFHAISFAYKQLKPEQYFEISKGLKELWSKLRGTKGFDSYVNYIYELCLKSLDPEEDAEAIEKYRYYVEGGAEIFFNSSSYKGNYSVILHGDCWSNNLMFKYDESKKLVDMRLLDFQFSNVGTPASDLAYCLYSGASKEVLDELDYYLKVYHDSLLETVKDFGCNPENVYPFEELKKDWKQHCKMGFTMGLMLWRGKLTDEGDAKDLTDMKDDAGTDYTATRYDEEAFRKISRDIILHLYQNDFL